MKTENHSIDEILSKNATSFFIPPFQRAYAWGRPEIERFFKDVLRIIESELDKNQNDKLEHFFGTLVIKEEKVGFANKSIVIDGQQRLTTCLLFLISLRDLEKDLKNKEFITENYLKNNYSTFQDKIKLKQVTKDWDSFRALINNQNPKPGLITIAYQLFIKMIKEYRELNSDIDMKHFIIALQRINVAVIFLDERPYKGEDPQIIFETLNSLGKPLTLSDLIRNYILLNMNSESQSEIYENIWHPMIEEILNDNTSEFFRDYLQLKLSKPIKAVSDSNTKEIYFLFRKFVENNFRNRNDFIDDIIVYSKWYKWIVSEEVKDIISKDSEKNKQIIELLRNIFHDITSEAFKPFVLGLLEYNQTKRNNITIDDDDFISILKIIQIYLIRRRVLGLTQGENKSIVFLCSRIKDLAQKNVSILDLLTQMPYNLRFPNDEEISKKLMDMNFYEDLKRYSKFILGKIEENNAKVAVDFRNTKITIEHIMPKTLNESWKQELGENYESIHKNYLHNIGNLILTEFNSEISNGSFSNKKLRLNSSSLKYRLFIINKEKWDEQSISEHQIIMIKWFLETFNLPMNYQLSANKKILDKTIFSFADDDIMDIAEGNKPVEFIIENKNIYVSSWQDVFLKFIQYIKIRNEHDLDLIIEKQYELFNKSDIFMKYPEFKNHYLDNLDMLNRYKKLDGTFYQKSDDQNDQNLYVHINISSRQCIRRILTIIEEFNISKDLVKIRLSNKN